MAKSRATIAAAVTALVTCTLANAAQPSQGEFLPPPPGSAVQNQQVYFNGKTPTGQWRAIASKQLVGTSNGTKFYQWHLSIYALRQGAYRLRYRSPANGGPLSHVTPAQGSKVWFPVQELRIVGAAALISPGTEQLVVQSHEMAADCGSSTVTVFKSGVTGGVASAVSIKNGCELRAAIGTDNNSIVLRGPYYAPDAPMCCPTKAHANAVLRYRDGKWFESPNYFKITS